MNLHDAFTVEQLARMCHTSQSRFAELFREQIGHPPVLFQTLCRMERAKDLLLLTSDPVSTVAEEVGFDDPKYFSRCFRQHVGVSPRRFRRRRP